MADDTAPLDDQDVQGSIDIARRRLGQAAQLVSRGHRNLAVLELGKAALWATRAVLLARGVRVAKPGKIEARFVDVVAPLVGPRLADRVRILWAAARHVQNAGTITDGFDVDELTEVMSADIETLCTVATSGLEAFPESAPERRTWEELTDDDREILHRIARVARSIVPAARLTLFGSRAKGTHRADSDWDLLILVPDETTPGSKGQLMGHLYTLGQQSGVDIERECRIESEWNSATCRQSALFDEVRRYGIEVPAEEGAQM
jgi:predicted nucleotidyltransferase